MIQLGLDLPIFVKGYFTLEKDLLNKTLYEMERLLGYQKGRLKQGADILILKAPKRTSDFAIMGTTLFPGHRLEKTSLNRAMNGEESKLKSLELFKRERLIKVVPLTIHVAAMKPYLSSEEYTILREINTIDRDKEEIIQELKDRGLNDNSLLVKQLKENYRLVDKLYKRQKISDNLYPSAKRAIYQWRLLSAIQGRCVCRMTNYRKDRYTRML